MDQTLLPVLHLRSALEEGRSELIQGMLQLLDYSSIPTVTAAYAGELEGCIGPLLAAQIRLSPNFLCKLIEEASEQTAYWIVDRIRLDHIPVPAAVVVSFDELRHNLLILVQQHLAIAMQQPHLAGRFTDLVARLECLKNQLLVGARFAAFSGRQGKPIEPHERDIKAVANKIEDVFSDVLPEPHTIAKNALKRGCEWILMLSRQRFPATEFLLKQLPSEFIAKAAFVRSRHILLSDIEDFFDC